jgi:predicted NodU family carbamoyl transferase
MAEFTKCLLELSYKPFPVKDVQHVPSKAPTSYLNAVEKNISDNDDLNDNLMTIDDIEDITNRFHDEVISDNSGIDSFLDLYNDYLYSLYDDFTNIVSHHICHANPSYSDFTQAIIDSLDFQKVENEESDSEYTEDEYDEYVDDYEM